MSTLNIQDQLAFAALSQTLHRTDWTECNKTGVSPCDVCYTNNQDHAVICQTLPVSGRRLGNQDELRIVAMRFRNVGIRGPFPIHILSNFSALQQVVLASIPGAPDQNEFSGCVDENSINQLCSRIKCDFGSLPICQSSISWAGIAGGIVAVVVLLLVIGLVTRKIKQGKEPAVPPDNTLLTVNKRTGEFSWTNNNFRGNDNAATDDLETDTISSYMHPQRETLNIVATPKNKDDIVATLQAGHLGGINITKVERLASSKGFMYENSDMKNDIWSSELDEESGIKFWVNKKTGEFTWTNPH